MAMRRPGRAAFAFVFVTVALDMLALGIIVPVLPTLIVSFEGGSIERASTVTGWFGVAWALMQFVCSPLIGGLSDRFGRRPVILLSNLGLGVDYIVMAIAPSVGWLFLGRVLSGITSSSFPTAAAYITDVTPPAGRAARFGMLGAAFGLGFIIGPAVGGLVGAIDLRLPFWVAAGLSLANFAYGLFILPESLPPERRGPVQWHLAHPLGSIAFLRSRATLLGLGAAAFLYYVAHEVLPSLFVPTPSIGTAGTNARSACRWPRSERARRWCRPCWSDLSWRDWANAERWCSGTRVWRPASLRLRWLRRARYS
jgi:DHA1 family tetracycline resistance protein-like MFS transporter